MKKSISLSLIIGAAAFFGFFTIIDDTYISDAGIRQIYEDVVLAVTLAVIGVTSSKHFSDSTTESVLQEVRRMQSDFDKRLENLEFKFKQNKTNE